MNRKCVCGKYWWILNMKQFCYNIEYLDWDWANWVRCPLNIYKLFQTIIANWHDKLLKLTDLYCHKYVYRPIICFWGTCIYVFVSILIFINYPTMQYQNIVIFLMNKGKSSLKESTMSCWTCKNKDWFLCITHISSKLLSANLIVTFWWIIKSYVSKSITLHSVICFQSIKLLDCVTKIGNIPLLICFSTEIKSCHSYNYNFQGKWPCLKKYVRRTYANKHINYWNHWILVISRYNLYILHFEISNIQFFSLKKTLAHIYRTMKLNLNGTRLLTRNIRCL